MVEATAQGPNSVDKRQISHGEPCGAEIPDGMGWRAAEKIDGRIADEENRIFLGSQMVRWQRRKPRRNPLLSQKHLQKIDAGERGRITEDLFDFRQRFAMSEQNAFHFAERR